MNEHMSATEAIPALLATQLMAAEVYSTFLHMSRDGEKFLWKRMLCDELEHVEYMRDLLFSERTLDFHLPFINVERMRETCNRVVEHGGELFLLRLEGALRLEIAELDFGLEGLVARKMKKNSLLSDYPGDIATHMDSLLNEARRYSESPNIGMQITRLTELLETSVPPVNPNASRDNSNSYPR